MARTFWQRFEWREVRLSGPRSGTASSQSRQGGRLRQTRGDTRIGRAVIGGLVGGTLGALILLFHGAAVSFLRGQDVWLFPKLFALPFAGVSSLNPGFEWALRPPWAPPDTQAAPGASSHPES